MHAVETTAIDLYTYACRWRCSGSKLTLHLQLESGSYSHNVAATFQTFVSLLDRAHAVQRRGSVQEFFFEIQPLTGGSGSLAYLFRYSWLDPYLIGLHWDYWEREKVRVAQSTNLGASCYCQNSAQQGDDASKCKFTYSPGLYSIPVPSTIAIMLLRMFSSVYAVNYRSIDIFESLHTQGIPLLAVTVDFIHASEKFPFKPFISLNTLILSVAAKYYIWQKLVSKIGE